MLLSSWVIFRYHNWKFLISRHKGQLVFIPDTKCYQHGPFLSKELPYSNFSDYIDPRPLSRWSGHRLSWLHLKSSLNPLDFSICSSWRFTKEHEIGNNQNCESRISQPEGSLSSGSAKFFLCQVTDVIPRASLLNLSLLPFLIDDYAILHVN